MILLFRLLHKYYRYMSTRAMNREDKEKFKVYFAKELYYKRKLGGN